MFLCFRRKERADEFLEFRDMDCCFCCCIVIAHHHHQSAIAWKHINGLRLFLKRTSSQKREEISSSDHATLHCTNTKNDPSFSILHFTFIQGTSGERGKEEFGCVAIAVTATLEETLCKGGIFRRENEKPMIRKKQARNIPCPRSLLVEQNMQKGVLKLLRGDKSL